MCADAILTMIIQEFSPDAVITFALDERGGPPNAAYNVSCLGIKEGLARLRSTTFHAGMTAKVIVAK